MKRSSFPDVFWVGLAVAIMAGLSFGTLLTMFLVPVLYATFYGLQPGLFRQAQF